MEKQKTGFGITALVLGIVGLVLSFIPFINNLAFFLGILGVVFGIVALVTHNKKGISIAGLVTGILAIVITLTLQASWSRSLNEVSESLEETSAELADMSGENTEQLIGTAVDIQLGEFTADESKWESGLTVTVTNLTDEQASFDITIEAADADGNRLDTDWVYISELRAGQTATEEVFNLVSTDDYEALRNATFSVLEVSKY